MKKILFRTVVVALISLILFTMAFVSVFNERGYFAWGGEWLILLIPVTWWYAEAKIESKKRQKEKEKAIRKEIEAIDRVINKFKKGAVND